MPITRVAGPLFILSVLGLAAGTAWAAWPHDPTVNVPLSTASGDQWSPRIISDNAGGAIVTWFDIHIYAQRIDAAGVPRWTTNGVPVCTAPIAQYSPTIAPDGAGGAIIAWTDGRTEPYFDIYAQRVSATGVPQWTANGVALCTATNQQDAPRIISDGAGGAIVTWMDLRSGNQDIYAQHVNAAGVPQWTANGVAICTAVGDQFSPIIVSDGTGGAVISWYDRRFGTNYDVYAQRVNAAGVPQWNADGVSLLATTSGASLQGIASDGAGGAIIAWSDRRNSGAENIYAQRMSADGGRQWGLLGVALCTAPGSQAYLDMVSDGAGGAIVAWVDTRSGSADDIYAQRVSRAGVPLWALNGVPISTAMGNQSFPTVVSDGTGGAIVAWEDSRNANVDVYSQRVSAAGVPLWTLDGVAVSTAFGDHHYPTIASDGAGGAITTWYDHRNVDLDIFAQRIERYGYLGSPEPAIASVRDVPNDQGGKVKLSWYASYIDADPFYHIDSYRVWRSAPPNLVSEAVARGARITQDPDDVAAVGNGALLATKFNGTAYFWDLVATQAAGQLTNYAYIAPTTSDSVGGSNPPTVFMVEATVASSVQHWYSTPDSGYSVDNLPPVSPAPFTGQYSMGTTHLHWSENTEPDLAGYRLYRGTSSEFMPAPGNLVVAKADTGFSDVGPAGNYYKLSAVDIHGNQSGFALLTPAQTTGTPGPSLPQALLLGPMTPNPARAGSQLRFALPRAAQVELAVYDSQGRLVLELAHGTFPPGDHIVPWDGRDRTGRGLGNGLYFTRLRAEGRTLHGRFIVLN